MRAAMAPSSEGVPCSAGYSLLAENARAWKRILAGATDSLDYAALAYTLHNVYCLLENYLLRIAKFFENNLDPETWHRDLVRRMAVDGTQRPCPFSRLSKKTVVWS